MREIPYPGAGNAAPKAGFTIHFSPPAVTSTSAAPYLSPASAKCDVSSSCPWWPYSNSNDFKANTALVLVFLFCTLICAVAFNAAIRYMCARRRQMRTPANRKADLGCDAAEQEPEIPDLVYSEGMKLVECPICLSEFAIGERIRVLEKCRHGFHSQCIGRWLVSHSSCPNCRANCP